MVTRKYFQTSILYNCVVRVVQHILKMEAAARSLQCSACEEAKPPGAKPVAASHDNREPWRTVGCDLAEWNHPISEMRKVHLWICVDEATKFTVGHVGGAEGQQVGNIDGSRLLELLQERWIAIFGRMHTLRTDPEGAWRNKEVHERLSDMQIVLDVHPGEASWQASVTGKHHRNCEGHDDENRVGKTRSQS